MGSANIRSFNYENPSLLDQDRIEVSAENSSQNNLEINNNHNEVSVDTPPLRYGVSAKYSDSSMRSCFKSKAFESGTTTHICADNSKMCSEEQIIFKKDEECPICYEIKEDMYKTHCNHFICNTCIDKIFNNDNKCPICRVKLQKTYDNPPLHFECECDFSFLNCERIQIELTSAYNTITQINKWEFLKNYNPNVELGFMFDQEEELNNIKNIINFNYNDLHSGYSLAITMRHMNMIAKYGFDNYKEMILINQ